MLHFLVGKSEENLPLGRRISVDERIILKWIFEKWEWMMRTKEHAVAFVNAVMKFQVV
jgi:hypothetical protein